VTGWRFFVLFWAVYIEGTMLTAVYYERQCDHTTYNTCRSDGAVIGMGWPIYWNWRMVNAVMP
jgi:hypothetical protein